MSRLMLSGACLCFIAALSACAHDEDGRQTSTREGSQHDLATEPAGNPGAQVNPTAGRTGPLRDGGAASCVEEYRPSAVANRAFAFDGVVVDIGPATSDRGDASNLDLAGTTFTVRAWFRGGGRTAVTVDMPPPTEGALSDGGGPSYGIGSRLLVSGEPRWGGAPLADAIAWGCGFTRYYDAETATSWNQVLAEPG